MKTKKQLEKIMSKTIPEPNSGCWIWLGTKDNNGYGRIYIGPKKTSQAHRVFYELLFGKLRDDQLVCHKCDVRLCINPDHLFIGTAQDNSDDMRNKQRHRTAYPWW